MSERVSGAASEEVLAAIEGNLAVYYEVMARMPGVQVEHTGELLRIYSGIPNLLYNGVAFACLAPERAGAAIEDARRFFEARRVPWLWSVGPSSEPSDLGERLVGQGLLFLSEAPGMAVEIAAVPETPAPPELVIREVEGPGALDAWLAPFRQVFGLPEEGIALTAQMQGSAGFGPGAPMRCFLGRVADEPVTCAQLILGGGVAGVYSVATLPDVRGRGYGTAMTLACLHAARASGCRVAVLQATAMGWSLYQRLGFREVCTFRFYEG